MCLSIGMSTVVRGCSDNGGIYPSTGCTNTSNVDFTTLTCGCQWNYCNSGSDVTTGISTGIICYSCSSVIDFSCINPTFSTSTCTASTCYALYSTDGGIVFNFIKNSHFLINLEVHSRNKLQSINRIWNMLYFFGALSKIFQTILYY